MSVIVETFTKADSLVIGPDQPWSKFPVTPPGTLTGIGPDDGEVLANRFAVYGGDRTGLSAPIQAGAFARCDTLVDDVTQPVTIAAPIAALDLTDDGMAIYNYPIFFLGVGVIDSTPAGELDFGPAGLWVEVDPHWDVAGPTGSAFLVYGSNNAGSTFGFGGGSFTTFPTLDPGDVLTLEAVPATPTTGTYIFKVNGVTLQTDTYDLSLVSGGTTTFGTATGIGIMSFWGPAGSNDYVAGSDAWDTVTITATFPAAPPPPPFKGLVRAALYDNEYNLLGALPIRENSAQWEEQRSEAGAGSVETIAYLPDGTPNPMRPVGDQFVTFTMADGLGGVVNAWTMLVEDDDKVRVAQSRGARKIKVLGRGPLALYEDSQVYPTLGYASFPTQVDMYYDWRHKDHDDSAWLTPQSFGPISDFQAGGGGIWWTPAGDLPWGSFPSAPSINDPDLIHPSVGDNIDAPVGKWYTRHRITLPASMTYNFFGRADNVAMVYLDSVPIASIGGTGDQQVDGWLGDATTPARVYPFYASAGEHMLTVEVTNLPRPDSITGNPTGLVYAGYVPGFPTSPASCVFSTADYADIKILEYPAEPEGMSPTKAVRLFVELAQFHGDLPLVDISSFDDTHWSDGSVIATPYPCISTKVLTDGLTFLREVSGTYTDMRADRDNPFRLLLYNKGTMNAGASGVSFLPGVNLDGMNIRRDYKVANVLIGVIQSGYIEVEDSVSVALVGRRPRRFELGSIDNDFEAVRVLTEALTRYAHVRDEISVQVQGPVGYLDYDIGQPAPTLNSDDAPVTEAIEAISVRQGPTGIALATPTLKDLFFAS